MYEVKKKTTNEGDKHTYIFSEWTKKKKTGFHVKHSILHSQQISRLIFKMRFRRYQTPHECIKNKTVKSLLFFNVLTSIRRLCQVFIAYEQRYFPRSDACIYVLNFFFCELFNRVVWGGCPFIMIFMEIFGSSVNNFMEIFGIFGIQFPLGFRKNEFVQKVRKFYKFYFILVIQVHFLCMNYHTIIISMRRDIPSDPIFYFKSSWNVSSQLNVIRILVWV